MNNFLNKLYLFRFLDAAKLIGMIFTLFFQHNGLNTFQISVLIVIWSVSTLILEVPLGVVADKYPRRNLLIAAQIIQILGFLFWFKSLFLFYALGFILWGTKNALTSGTLEAFVYDELKSFNKDSLYEKVNGRMETFFWVGIAFSAIVGTFVASFSFTWTLIVTIFSTVLTIFVLLTLKSVKPTKSTSEQKYFVLLKEAIAEIKNNKSLLWLIFFFCFIFATYGAADEYWSLIYQNLGVSLSFIGILLAIGYGLFSLAGYTTHHFKMNHSEYFLIALSAFLFIGAGIFRNPFFSLPLIFFALYFFKISHIKFEARFQHSIRSDQRATISSLKSLIFEVIYLFFVLLFGWISNLVGINSLIYILGIFLIFWLVVFNLIADIGKIKTVATIPLHLKE